MYDEVAAVESEDPPQPDSARISPHPTVASGDFPTVWSRSQEDLDRVALIHRPVAGGGLLERELSTRSDEFRHRWGAHNVRTHGTGVKHFHHRVVGDLTLAWESLDLRAEPGLTTTFYTAEPRSPTEHALALLASWAATQDAQDTRADERASHNA